MILAIYFNEKAMEKLNEKLLDTNEFLKGTTVVAHIETDDVKGHLIVDIDSICVEGHTLTISEGDKDFTVEMKEEGERSYEELETENSFQYSYRDKYWFELVLDFI